MKPIARSGGVSTINFWHIGLCALWFFGIWGTFEVGTADAKPTAPATFCQAYPESAHCIGGQQPACVVCHNGPPVRNIFGAAVEAELLPGTTRPLTDSQFNDALPGALEAIEDDDTDGDGHSNYDEIVEGSRPGDSSSVPEGGDCPDNDDYNLCDYDAAFAYRRVSLDFCGRSPMFDEMEGFRTLAQNQQLDAISTKLDECLDGAFWQGQDGVLWNLANRKIRPVGTLKAGAGAGTVAIGDYDHDYNLFVYSQIDDNDARDVMTANYFVRRESPTSLSVMTEEEVAAEFVGAATERIPPEFRSGLLTTTWTLLYFEMFAIIPRAAAAQASRAFLREDWARMEGLSPVSGLVDYDNAGIDAPGCAVCHTTIDFAAQAWKNYAGFVGGPRASYVPDRMNLFEGAYPGISSMSTGYFKGQQVPDLMGWADLASNSDPFASATVMDYWQILVGQEPTGATEIDEFATLWQGLRDKDNYRVEAMLRKLVFSRSYGEP